MSQIAHCSRRRNRRIDQRRIKKALPAGTGQGRMIRDNDETNHEGVSPR